MTATRQRRQSRLLKDKKINNIQLRSTIIISYKDKTFCSYWMPCKKGLKCDRALTSFVMANAETWWGSENPPICTYKDKPDCFKEIV
jgi:hypothetical protein